MTDTTMAKRKKKRKANNIRMTDTTMAKRKKKRKPHNIQNTTQKSKDRAT